MRSSLCACTDHRSLSRSVSPSPAARRRDDRVAFAELAFEHAQRQRIEHAALNRPLQRPRAVGRVVAFAHELFLGRVASARRESSVPRAASSSPRELDVDDLLHVLAAERVEEDDLVDRG